MATEELATRLETLLPRTSRLPAFRSSTPQAPSTSHIAQVDSLSVHRRCAGLEAPTLPSSPGNTPSSRQQGVLVAAGELNHLCSASENVALLSIDSDTTQSTSALRGGTRSEVSDMAHRPWRPLPQHSPPGLRTHTQRRHEAPNMGHGPTDHIDPPHAATRGLRFIDCRLFDLPPRAFDHRAPTVHIHSLVEYVDGSISRSSSVRICVCDPLALPTPGVRRAYLRSGFALKAHFQQQTFDRFPASPLLRGCEQVGAHTVALNAADEVAV